MVFMLEVCHLFMSTLVVFYFSHISNKYECCMDILYFFGLMFEVESRDGPDPSILFIRSK